MADPTMNADLAGVPSIDVNPGPIAADTTWSNVVNVKGSVTVNAGVTLTIAAGAVVRVAGASGILVDGTLRVQGTSAQRVLLDGVTTAAWTGVSVRSGGRADIAWATVNNTTVPVSCAAGTTLCKLDHTRLNKFTGYGMNIAAPATLTYLTVENGGADGVYATLTTGQTLTVTDSIFRTTGGDALVMNGTGNYIVDHNTISAVNPGTIGQHCACHFNGTGTYTVTANNFDSSSVGFMASGMSATSAVTGNNFYSNTYSESQTGVGVNAAADLTNNWWAGMPPPAILGNSKTMPYAQNVIPGTGPR
jgi:hypothetical protein